MDAGTPAPTEQPYPLGERIIHADIKSIEPEGPTSGNGSPVIASPGNASPEEKDAQERSEEMQRWWDEAIRRNMDLPDGYQNVAVLMVKWADELDELKTRTETLELEAMFRDCFHYKTEIVELNVSSKPQHQLNCHLASFVERHDGRGNLLIVYYTGHGVYRSRGNDSYLELTAFTSPTMHNGLKKEARANWNKAEEVLRDDDVDGDVLTILDTCFSSNLAKSGKDDGRTYELMSACALDGTTASPGPNSFTRALIDALKELLNEYRDKSFTTFQLNQRILLNPVRRDMPSQLWYRLQHHERHIRLSPLNPEDRERQKALLRHPARGHLTLRFALRDAHLNQEQIEYLTKNLSKAFNSKYFVPLQRIDWLGIKPARSTDFGQTALALYACAQWKKFLKHRREERASQISRSSSSNMEASPASPARKRAREEMDMSVEPEGCPKSKRELLVVPQLHGFPPSPPVSDSS